ncbi:hypothetical protein EYZ11_010469 [Aspergillus tanneri]|uniref:Heterokaryon incompatibility domain-containing protein n=1 Tax=Aspergillus tanneri TaxID=1220188 RepID=A0A4S3J591_9EURO|nr:hypothetical protein EYZ11_010469 [Aspergillus tanneri]
MDHLPEIEAEPYDGGDFLTYPARRRFDPDICESDEVGWVDPSGYTAHDRTAIFQEWLFFGTLSEILDAGGVRLIPAEFVCGGCVTTRKLDYYIRQAIKSVNRQQGEEIIVSVSRIETVVDTVRRYASFRPPGAMAVTLGSVCPERWPVALSITILCEGLLMLVSNLPNSKGVLMGEQIAMVSNAVTGDGPGLMEKLLVRRIMDAGWCPNQIAGYGLMDASLAYYLGMLAPKIRMSHERCRPNFAACNQLQDNYMIRHADLCDSQECRMFHVDLQNLEDIINDGALPVVWVDEKDGSIKVVRRDPSKAYLAISHVWSQGLGNPAANALPICQIYWIWVNDGTLIRDKAGVWIDTLCVPVSGPCRKQSIRRMGSIYGDASAVLVLDEELLRTPCSNIIEQTCRLGCCSWQRRLWTLQEGCLNVENLYFIFRDGILNYWTLLESALDHETALVCTIPGVLSLPFRHLVFRLHYGSFVETGASLMENEPTWVGILLSLLETLPWRATSRSADETLCISTIMGIDPGPLLEIPDAEDRMKHFLHSLSRVPQELLFIPGPKFANIPGLGWASKSFLGTGIPGTIQNKWTTPTEKGLPITTDGAVLSPIYMSLAARGEQDLNTPWTPISQDVVAIKGHAEEPWSFFTVRDITLPSEGRLIDLSGIPRPGLILRHELSSSIACLVSLGQEGAVASNECLFGQFRALVSLQRMPTLCTQDGGQSIPILAGQLLGASQNWVVG